MKKKAWDEYIDSIAGDPADVLVELAKLSGELREVTDDGLRYEVGERPSRRLEKSDLVLLLHRVIGIQRRTITALLNEIARRDGAEIEGEEGGAG